MPTGEISDANLTYTDLRLVLASFKSSHFEITVAIVCAICREKENVFAHT